MIILEESLGAEFVGALGGLPLTPRLDRLQGDGIWFERLYATGVRSVRGIEAVITGFPPSTARSVVKLPRSQRDFFTIAELLETKGYRTSFLYGGEPQFDNMGRFFANNGFQTIIGRHEFEDPVFEGAWGVSDEDLFRRAHERFSAAPRDEPFFSLIFTSSNHSPWDFPEGRIELYESPAATRHNAVKYADYALGQFIDDAPGRAIMQYAENQAHMEGDRVVILRRDHAPSSFRFQEGELVPAPAARRSDPGWRTHLPCPQLSRVISCGRFEGGSLDGRPVMTFEVRWPGVGGVPRFEP